MLRKLLFQHQRNVQLAIAIFGAFSGLFLLLSALQLYNDVSTVFERKRDLNGQQYLVINKEVGVLNTLFGGKKGFDTDELNALKQMEGVVNVAPLTTSRFKINISASTGERGMPGFYTEIFFEAVPIDFIDAETNSWNWREGDSLVPVIIPRDYMRLYNFGFAPTKGLPQITEGLVGLARFTIGVSGENGSATFKGKLAGFSDRINTILAPQAFIDYSNERFANVKPESVLASRVIISCEGNAMGKLANYLSEKGYETNAEGLRSGRLQSILNTILTVVTILGILIIVLALLNFILYAQLLLSKSAYELQTLLRIGYTPAKLSRIYILFYALIYSGVLLLSLLLIFIGKPFLSDYILSKSPDLEFESGISMNVVGAGLLCVIFFITINFITIRRGLNRLFST